MSADCKNCQILREKLASVLYFIQQLPGGIDEDADPLNTSPDNMFHHIGGLIYQIVKDEKPISRWKEIAKDGFPEPSGDIELLAYHPECDGVEAGIEIVYYDTSHENNKDMSADDFPDYPWFNPAEDGYMHKTRYTHYRPLMELAPEKSK